MTKEYLDFMVGSPLRNCVIKNIEKVSVKVPIKDAPTSEYADAEKICLTVTDRNNKEFRISDVWIEKYGEAVIKGLWFTLSDSEKLSPSSSVAQLLSYYKVDTLKELINKQVQVFPDDKNYLVIIACKDSLIP